eukprot:scaffold69347_cov60-Phaeocystis_antarctica.AAC.3
MSTRRRARVHLQHVAQLGEDDALLVPAQLRERHRGAAQWACGAKGPVESRNNACEMSRG